jgi:hypothetical protein
MLIKKKKKTVHPHCCHAPYMGHAEFNNPRTQNPDTMSRQKQGRNPNFFPNSHLGTYIHY